MLAAVNPQASLRRSINQAVRADINQCYTCASCVTECPVNRATNKLQPRKLVWMANLGLLDELLRLPDIWYCLGCNRCSHVCPMSVKPAALIRFLHWEAVRAGVVPAAMHGQLQQLHREFQGARRQVAADLLDQSSARPTPAAVRQTPFQGSDRDAGLPRRAGDYLGYGTNLSSCFACEECSNACPISLDRSVFDPLRIIRMANMGIKEPLLRSPSLWLCIQCQSCTQSCGQAVKGHLVISRLQQLAVEENLVPADFRTQWQARQALLYGRFLKAVDGLLAAPGDEAANA